MDEKNLTPAEELKNTIDSAIETKATEATEAAVAKSAEAIEAVKTELAEKSSETNELLQKQVDDLKAEVKSFNINTKNSKPMTFQGQVLNALNEKKDELAAFKNKEINGVSLDLKTLGYGAGDAGVTGVADSKVPYEDRVGAIKFDPHFKRRIRNYMPTGSSSGDSVRYNVQGADSNPAAVKAHAAAFGNWDANIENKSATMETYGAFIKLAEEQLDDVLGLNSYITSQLMAYTMDTEDAQILLGTGASNQFNGIHTEGTTFAATRVVGATANVYDVLEDSWAQLAANNYEAGCIVLHPNQFSALRSLKSTQGEYILGQLQQGLVPTLFGAEIVVNPAIGNDNFVVFDKMATQLWMREGITVQFERDGTDFSTNQITARAKGRANVTNYLPAGIIKGAVTTAITDLTS